MEDAIHWRTHSTLGYPFPPPRFKHSALSRSFHTRPHVAAEGRARRGGALRGGGQPHGRAEPSRPQPTPRGPRRKERPRRPPLAAPAAARLLVSARLRQTSGRQLATAMLGVAEPAKGEGTCLSTFPSLPCPLSCRAGAAAELPARALRLCGGFGNGGVGALVPPAALVPGGAEGDHPPLCNAGAKSCPAILFHRVALAGDSASPCSLYFMFFL